MTTTMPAEALRFASVDDALGDRGGRFFGEGFKRVTHAVTDVTICPGTPERAGRIDATAGIRIPDIWSRKGRTDQRPHLSTIDAMLIAAQLTGLYAAHTFQLTPDEPFLVRSLSIKAGRTPDEESLDRFAVRAIPHSTDELAALNRRLTTTECAIGSMTVRVTVEHARGVGETRTEGRYQLAEQLPGPWNDAPYGASHRVRHQFLTDVEADTVRLQASAELAVTRDRGGTRPAGTPLTMIDLFTSALQLGQILLYQLDDLDRAASHTLWMRSTSITPARTSGNDGRFQVRLLKPAKLPTKAGTWRSARIVAAASDMELSCNVAHLLP